MKRPLEMLLWIATIAMALAAARASHSSLRDGTFTSAPPVAGDIVGLARVSDSALGAMSEIIVQENVFRLARRPTSILFGNEPAAVPTPSPAVQRPLLVLAGVIGGPPWEALLEGVPGVETAVLARSGEEVAGYLVIKVEASKVVLRGHDTTMTLLLRRINP